MALGIITRGLGTPLLITRGYGTIPAFIPEIIDDIRIRHGNGGGGAKRRAYEEELRKLEPIIVWARLIEVNNQTPMAKIEGRTSTPGGPKINPPVTKVEYITQKVRKAWRDIKVIVTRLK